MIDTDELRRKISSVDIVDHIDIHANVKSTLAELLDNLEEAEKERGWNLKANRMCREALLMMPVMVLPTPTTVFGSLGKEISLPFRLNLV